MRPILEINNISKSYRIAHERQAYLTFRDKLTGLFKPSEQTEEFWALKDVSFEVYPGESVGIIGRNGAGKSTLLKILSRITPPTSGSIIARGRIASLLEVGTGFHQELTGRENIYMNGSILGMKKAEIKVKFDEIIDFSGVEKFLDTPLKNYSSGMQLRLAFAVAAHLEPEILIIDEVLAVGDAEFQKKCIGKMGDVSKSGRTILFVSHNLATLKAISNRGILLDKGLKLLSGTMDEVIHTYTTALVKTQSILDGLRYFRKGETVHSVLINNTANNKITVRNNQIQVSIDVSFTKRMPFELQVHLKRDGAFLCSYSNFIHHATVTYDPGRYQLKYHIQLPELKSGSYTLDLYFTEPFVTWFANSFEEIELDVINTQHQAFLNSQAFEWWGHVLMPGSIEMTPKN